ncbi:MAG: long-chain fatty acid--CoA ligase [Oligoflexia bacterium]|nr:long-chain fatty acid--CoA ligase [Oligoflexia bacterium]
MPTVLHRLSRWAETDPQAPAQRYKKLPKGAGRSAKGEWVTLSSKEFMDRVFHLALYLDARGFGEKDISCIFAYNSPEWVHMDLAAMLLRGKSTGIYPNSTVKDVHYILNHTESTVLAVQNKEYFLRFARLGSDEGLPPSVKLILVFDGDTSIHPKAVAYSDAIAEGARLASGKSLADYLAKIDPHAGAFLIYTSGTTGNPKGAILSHDNLVFTSDAVARFWQLPPQGSLFSFLPLCHIAEKLQNEGVGISQRHCVNFCTKFENLSSELVEVQPTLLLSVPRLWEKMMEGVQSKIRNAKGAKKKLAPWALEVGARVAQARYSGRFPNPIDLAQLQVAERVVLSKIREALGLSRAEKTGSGAAALAPHISRWFRGLGVEVMEDFGQTESTGVICMTEPGVESAGTVGKPVPPIEVRIAEDGEVLCRGRNVFKGYLKDDAATAQVLEGGWLHTGDVGEYDSRGLLRIKGRKKEVMKTSGGKMVAPLPIEERLKSSPLISQVCLVGDGHKYLSALITLTEETLNSLKSTPGAIDGQLVKEPGILKKLKADVDALNKELAGYEQIKRIAVLSREFSIEDGEMTPTMKIKRNVIEKRFATVIESMYPNRE